MRSAGYVIIVFLIGAVACYWGSVHLEGPPFAGPKATPSTSVLGAPFRLEAAGAVIDCGDMSEGHCGPTLVDLDGDGVIDLVVGDYSGRFRFYRNRGTNRQPEYEPMVYLRAGDEEAKVPIC